MVWWTVSLLTPMHTAATYARASVLLAAVAIAGAAAFDVAPVAGAYLSQLRQTQPRAGTLHTAARRALHVATWCTILIGAVEAGRSDGHGFLRGGVSLSSSAAVAAATAAASAVTGGATLFALGKPPATPVRQYRCFSLLNMPSTKQIADLVRFAKEECFASATSKLRRPAARRSDTMRCTSDGGRLVKDPYLRLVKTAPKSKVVTKEEGMRLKKQHVLEALQTPFPHSENRYELPQDCAWAIAESLKQHDLARFRHRQLERLRQLDRKTRRLNAGLLASGQSPPHVAKLIQLNSINIVLVAVLIEALEYPDVELPLRLLTGMPIAGDLTRQDSHVFREVWQANSQDKPLSPQGNPEALEFAIADFEQSHETWLQTNRSRMRADAHAAIRLAKAGNPQRLDLLKRVQRSTENEVWNHYMGSAMSEQQMRAKYSRNGKLQARVIPRFPIVQGTKPKRCEQCDRQPTQCPLCVGHSMPGLRCCDDAKRSGTNAVTRHRETVRCPSFEFPARAAAEFVTHCQKSSLPLPHLLLGCDDIAMAYRTVPNAQPELCVVALYDFTRNDISYYDVFGLNFGLASAPGV